MKTSCKRRLIDGEAAYEVEVTLGATELAIARLKSRTRNGICEKAFDEGSGLSGMSYVVNGSKDSAPHVITLFPERYMQLGITGTVSAEKYVQKKIEAYLK